MRRIRPRTRAGWRATDKNVPRHERRKSRDIGDDLAERENHPAGAVILPQRAIDPRRQPDVGKLAFIRIRHQPRTHGAGPVKVLALGDIELGMAHPVADGAFIAEGKPSKLRQRLALGNAPAALANDDDDLALIIQLRRFRRADHGLAMPGKGPRKADEQRHVRRHLLPVFVLRVAVWKVHPDADDFFGIEDGNIEHNVRERAIRCVAVSLRSHSGRT